MEIVVVALMNEDYRWFIGEGSEKTKGIADCLAGTEKSIR